MLIDNTKLFKWKHGKKRRDDEIPVVINAKGRAPMGKYFLWRERYNEDTILSLDAMGNGYATIQFNAFLQGKAGTQKLKGGNTEVFYAVKDAEWKSDDEQEKYNEVSTIRKSLTLQKVYPKIAKVLYRFNRPHHLVDYSKYQPIPLRLKKSTVIPAMPNEYGMELVTWNASSSK